MYFLILTSTMMLFIKHPLSLGFNILIHTIMTSILMGMFSTNFWFSYILMLIMIGGLLVLFIYMTSIASNEKFKFNYKLLIIMTMIFIFIIINILFYNKFLLNMNLSNELINMNNFNLNLNKFINFPNSNMFIIIMLYLLISMIAIVKITKTNSGPLRQLK
uniref:NADH-ubiquinone oxidoreductase chain 6 n=1 Tax=Coccinella transversoguttata TaxID=1790162 RepID=A0A411DAI9_9CUCU|nr:NADH dehydrogenase subunit 6 [Coccinella transversoguttata]